MNLRKTKSLEQSLRLNAGRWALAGLCMTLFLAVPCILYSAKIASERQLLVTAQSAARAFRPMILQDDIRNAELQMRKALELKTSESAIVRDLHLNAIYPLQESDKTNHCGSPNKYCWKSGFSTVSMLYPIYFDSQNPETLYGYLELNMTPTVDFTTISILALLLVLGFTGQAYGLSSALNQTTRKLGKQLTQWADHLHKSPESPLLSQNSDVPFIELLPMQNAIDSLYLEIERLRDQTAKKTKFESQFALLREISHDLKTPHSLLAKYFAIHLDTVRTSGKCNDFEVGKVESTLKRMGELIRQVRIVPLGQASELQLRGDCEVKCNLKTETQLILEDFQHDPDKIEKKISIEDSFATHSDTEIKITGIGFYRIVENLIRNAIEAAPSESGKIAVFTSEINGKPSLSVRDNGCGIPFKNRERILQFDFTTKPSRGTGLGLGIVEKICKEFGATLQFENNVDQGTTFTVHFKSADPVINNTKFEEAVYAEV